MLQLNNLESLVKSRKRRGRGGSRGGTSGRGHKGQLARSGGRSCVGLVFEGGQMPYTRRLPRRGFTNRDRVSYKLISLADLDRCFQSGDVVDVKALYAQGFIKGKQESLVKLLAVGSLTKSLTVRVHACSASAREMVEKAGGSVALCKEMSGDSTTA